jgi:hypothetical protein
MLHKIDKIKRVEQTDRRRTLVIYFYNEFIYNNFQSKYINVQKQNII